MEQSVQINVMARLEALEYLLGHLFSVVYRQTGVTPDMARLVHQSIKDDFARLSIPGLAPEQSDHFAAEVEAAVAKMLDRVLAVLESIKDE